MVLRSGSLYADVTGWHHQGMHRRIDDLGLKVRPVEPRDLDALVVIHGDPRTNEHNPSGPLLDAAAGRRLLERWQRDWAERGIGYWAVDADGLGTVGFAGVRYLDTPERPVFNLYYRFIPAAWGRGYATAVAAVALAAAAGHDPDTPVIARMQPRNGSSERVAIRIGLRHVGQDPEGRLVLADRELPNAVIARLPPG
jgi:RimJ/RimL family protein N-acetyltransferase